MSRIPTSRLASGAVAGVLALALAAAAQAQDRKPDNVDPADRAAAAEAQALRAEASQLCDDPQEWHQVMELRAEAASVAPLGDSLRIDDLWAAGVLAASMGELRRAQDYLVEAAEVALAFGKLPAAAEAYAVAAVVAAKQGAFETSDELLAKVDLLAHSPLMPEDFCACMEERLAMLSENFAYLSRSVRR